VQELGKIEHLLTREDIQREVRERFWELPGASLTPLERHELMLRIVDYLGVVEEAWLRLDEVEALQRVHSFLYRWLEEGITD
jgi:hypothetical protein